MIKDDITYVVWEHEGHHSHARPPGGSLTKHEEDSIDKQGSKRAKVTVNYA